MRQDYVEFCLGDRRLVNIADYEPLFGSHFWWEFCDHCNAAYRTSSLDVVFVKYVSEVLTPPQVQLIPRHTALCRQLDNVSFIKSVEPLRYYRGEEAIAILYGRERYGSEASVTELAGD